MIGKSPWTQISPSGMSSMGISTLRAKEICAIIKTCARSGVTDVELGDFKIKFGAQKGPEGAKATTEGTQLELPELGTADGQIPKEQMDILQKRAVEDLAQAQTLIDSPEQFETDMVNGLLYDKGAEDGSQGSTRVRAAL